MVLVRTMGEEGGQERPAMNVTVSPAEALATAKGREPVSEGEPLQSVTVNIDAEAGSTPTASEAVRALPNNSDPANGALKYLFRSIVMGPAPPSALGVPLAHPP
jgi:hypothetical protein